jgi:gliding motility-associated lipoprotein GldH
MIKGTSKHILPVIIALTWLVFSCSRSPVYTMSAPMPDEVWALDNIARFEPSVEDTLSSNNIYFTLRTGSAYPYQNIWLFVTTSSPSGKSITDTLQYMIADEKGKWYGRGFGDVRELNLPYKTNVFFREKGTYSFKVRHGMRTEDLKGVYDFGLRIVKAKK